MPRSLAYQYLLVIEHRTLKECPPFLINLDLVDRNNLAMGKEWLATQPPHFG